MNADGTGARRVVGNPGQPDTSPAWSPDGRRLVFVRNTGGTYVLGIANADGTKARLLKRAHSVYGSPSWSPTSNLIVYSDSGTALMAITPDGTRKHVVLERECPTGDGYTPKCTSFGDVAFSPDGSRIAVACGYCDADTEAGIWVLRADGTGLTRVTAVPGGHPAWSGDGRSIVFTGACGPPPAQGPSQVNQLCMIGADGSSLHALTTWPYGAGPPSWSWR
jgi:TolB protein